MSIDWTSLFKDQKNKDGSFFMPVQLVNNPTVALHCEPNVLPDLYEVDDPFYTKSVVFEAASDPRMVEMPWLNTTGSLLGPMSIDCRNMYINEAAFDAYKLAHQAVCIRDRKKRVALANEALSVHSDCVAAFDVLATDAAETLEDALSYYQLGVKAAPKHFSPRLLAECLKEGKIWDNHPLRALYRCQYGVALTLRKMRHYDEAIEEYKKLLKMDNEHRYYSSYVNVKATIPDCYLALRRYDELTRFLNEHSQPNGELASSCLAWHWPRALLSFVRATEKERKSALIDNIEINQQSSLAIAFCTALGANNWVAHYLTGKRRLPRNPDPLQLPGDNTGIGPGVAFARWNRHIWQAVPGAIVFLERIADIAMLSEATSAADLGDLQRLREVVDNFGARLNHDRDEGKRTTALHKASWKGHTEVVKYLISKGARVNIRDSEHNGNLSPLHMAAYNGHFEVVCALVENGKADLTLKDAIGATPIHMAINQGNAEIVEYLLEKMGNNANMLDQKGKSLLHHAVSSSVHMCLAGISECDRCQFLGHMPHAPNANPTRTAKILVEYGADINAVDRDREAPIVGAIYCGMDEFVVYLIERGVDIHSRGQAEFSPLEVAKRLDAKRKRPKMYDKMVEAHKRYLANKSKTKMIDWSAAADLKSRGDENYEMGYHKEAVSSYTEALTRMPQVSDEAINAISNPDHKELMLSTITQRSKGYFHLQQWKECMADCNDALVMQPKQAHVLFTRARARMQMNLLVGAQRDVKIALELEPGKDSFQVLLKELTGAIKKDSNAETAALDRCSYCGTQLQKRLRCGKCLSASYCDVQCQRRDWPLHRMLCKKLASSTSTTPQ